MRRLLAVAFFALSVSVHPGAQAPNTLKATFEALADPQSYGDPVEWGKLTTDDAVVIHGDGRIHTKRQEMDEMKKAKGEPSGKVKAEDVHTYGTTMLRRYETPSGSVMSQVFLQQSGKWLLAQSQETPITK